MKHITIFILIGFLPIASYPQKTCSIKKEYKKIFSIKKIKSGKRFFLFKKANKINNASCFSELINNNIRYIDYLRTHFSNNSNYDELLSIDDSIKLQKKFIQSLEEDNEFNEVMTKFTARFINKNHVQDTFSMNELLDVAVKFFFIKSITDKGFYAGKLCTGFNGINSTLERRKPQLEAFCFSTIVKNYKGKEFNMYEEFVKNIKKLYNLNLGINKEERLLRAQGAMYMLIQNNEVLKKMLLSEFQKKKQYLPFVIKLD